MEVCPTGATQQRDDGIVIVEKDKTAVWTVISESPHFSLEELENVLKRKGEALKIELLVSNPALENREMIRQAIPLLTYTSMLALAVGASGFENDERPSTKESAAPVVQELLRNACLDCHNEAEPTAGLNLESVAEDSVERNSDVWEKVVRKLRTRQMPPADMPRPKESTYVSVVRSLERTLDAIAVDHPRPTG